MMVLVTIVAMPAAAEGRGDAHSDGRGSNHHHRMVLAPLPAMTTAVVPQQPIVATSADSSRVPSPRLPLEALHPPRPHQIPHHDHLPLLRAARSRQQRPGGERWWPRGSWGGRGALGWPWRGHWWPWGFSSGCGVHGAAVGLLGWQWGSWGGHWALGWHGGAIGGHGASGVTAGLLGWL